MKTQATRGGKPPAASAASHSQDQSANGARKGSYKPYRESASESIMQTKFVELLAQSCGKTVVATVSSGAKYKGLLLSVDPSPNGTGALSAVLLKPLLVLQPLLDEKSNVDNVLPQKLVIQSKDLLQLEVTVPMASKNSDPAPKPALTEGDTDTSPPIPAQEKIVPKVSDAKVADATPPAQETSPVQPKTQVETKTLPAAKAKTPELITAANPKKESSPPALSFKTDRDISSGYKFKEKEFQKWVPDADTPEISLEADSGGVWDQFKVNQEKFGVQSSYDEHLYTTRVNREAADYQERLQRAERLAREIEGLSTSDRHVLEERGVVVDDSGMDEEDKYSGVLHDSSDTRGNELMAALRNASISGDKSGPIGEPAASSGHYATPRQRAAQYHNDPAIVSSSATQKVQELRPAGVPEASEKSNAPPASVPSKPKVPQQGESLRLNAQSEFNSLREFSANFKVPHKIPNDLLPILTKDKLKQDEIMKKQQAVKNAAPVLSASSSLSSIATSSVTQKAVGTEKKTFKLNPKAAAFTPSKQTQLSSPTVPKAVFGKGSNNPSPRMMNQRPYSNSSSGSGSARRHYQVTAAEFFGGADKVPTPESQKEKVKAFQTAFNLFVTAKRRHGDSKEPLVLEKAFATPPTWDSTTEENYEQFFTRKFSSSYSEHGQTPSPFMGSPLMAVPPGAPQMATGGGYPGAPGGVYPMSPQRQHPMAMHMQQQLHAAMMYPNGMIPGQPHFVQGMDPQHMHPGQFAQPGFVGGQAGFSGSMAMNNGSQYVGSPNHLGPGAQHHNGRRYNNQGKRGSHSHEKS